MLFCSIAEAKEKIKAERKKKGTKLNNMGC
jgi:hypothetical protein